MTKLRLSARNLLLIGALLPVLLAGCQSKANMPAADSPTASSSDTGAPSASAGEAATDSPAPATDSQSASPSDTATAAPSPTAKPADGNVSMGNLTALRLADFKSGWAGGAGWIARTDDSGASWTVQYEDIFAVKQIFALNTQQAWATMDIGDGKGVNLIQTTDGGKHWTAVGMVPNYAFLHFVSDKEAFSGNARTTDGGKSWMKLSVPDGAVGDVYYHDKLNGWAVTQTVGKKFSFLHTNDGGKSWATVRSQAWEGEIGTIIHSAGKKDAWIELIGDSGMSQTSYSLFHTADGGKSWTPVVANNTAGAGPAPGYKGTETNVPSNTGSKPGVLYVVNTTTAFLGGTCPACDNSNTMGHTTDGGKTWVNGKAAFPGYGEQLLAAADAKHVWWINTDSEKPAVMYTSSDGGANWVKTHTFDQPDSDTDK
jgi:photosystem II stability/assembly factor-like uncharacterized protein